LTELTVRDGRWHEPGRYHYTRVAVERAAGAMIGGGKPAAGEALCLEPAAQSFPLLTEVP